MADRSKIEWTDASWNPIRARNLATGKIGWHCEHVSEGCRNCYAETFNRRLGTGLDYKPGNRERLDIFLDEKLLLQPLHWKRPRKIFVGSMTDIFGDFVTDEMLDRIFAVMALCSQHTFQVLTKRPDRMRACVSNWFERLARLNPIIAHPAGEAPFSKLVDWASLPAILPNVWLGVSCEDQATADERIPDLLATPAAKHFISAEPQLGPINLERVGTIDSIRAAMPDVIKREEHGKSKSGAGSICGAQIDAIGPSGSSVTFFQTPDHMGGFTAASPRQWPCLDWVICGGESGPNARPMHPVWARSLRDQCAGDGVAFFFKQWGEWLPVGQHLPGYGKVCGGTAPKPGRMKLHYIDAPKHVVKHAFSEHGVAFGSMADNSLTFRVGKSRAGRLLDGLEHNAFPEAG